jgi:hypothetical protein
MLRSLPLALLGAAFVCNASASAQTGPCAVTAADLNQIVLPVSGGAHVVKMRVGPVLTLGTNSVIALTSDGVLWLVRDAINAPVLVEIAEGVTDFAIAPTPAGLAHVLTVGVAGLKRGALTSGGDGTLGALVDFSETPLAQDQWSDATRIDAAYDAGSIEIVASAATKILRARWTPATEQFVEQDPTTSEGPVQFLALADLTSDDGLELAIGSNALIALHGSRDGATLPDPYGSATPLLGSFIDVQRIPRGADTLDSLGLLERATVTDVFRELSSTGMSAPIASGGLRAGDISFGAMDLAPGCTSNCLQTDMALAMTDGEMLILNGHPQAAGGMQFAFDAAQLHYLNFATLLNAALVSHTRIACGDLDGDGDGDLAYAAVVDGVAKFVVVNNNCALSANETVSQPTVEIVGSTTPHLSVPSSLTGATELRVAVQVAVSKPSTFPLPPSQVRVRMFTRKYDALTPANQQDPISPFLWFDRTLLLSCPSPFGPTSVCPLLIDTGDQPLPVDFLDPGEQLNADNTLIYVEVTPQLEVSEGVFLSGLPTNWVGSFKRELLVALICQNELDEFSSTFACHVGAPLINEIHRRKRIRPIGTPPQ